ncbi:peptidylprolyl isomerase [Helicobacter zhangjianzhongii]|uniref:Peptidylprolyl isomerase n=1 Tax=Helicobacter zhangjianzhongii TaxID=2974574 RepID=A0ACC6FTJ8_9HELI|nr:MULTISPECIES: peptidylprolyl isomerase [unclassified Helicobacter]MDL0080605.1 peptidylprolyl isomerase [Helicobacter sp. CPD2-1]MDL0082544.1 peptidylprolyl isomerase [Helicobacter sp. XJK30-2]
MIEWMQKHKKWLVVTIWISAIAFIGAGGFAWGVYDYSLSGNSVAKVGQISISKAEFAQAYQNEFDRRNYQQGGTLDEAQAKEMGLDEQVLRGLISNALIRNYALDLGLRVSDEEIAREISTGREYEALRTDGVFDLKKYDQFIASNGISKQYFEEQVQQQLLTQKILSLIFPQIITQAPLPITPLERESLSLGFALQDVVELSVIKGASIAITPTQDQLKSYWEEHKDSYQTPASYQVQMIVVPTKDQTYQDDELQKFYEQNYITQESKEIPESIKDQVVLAFQQQKARVEALKEYSKLQKSEQTHAKVQVITQDSTEYSQEILQALESSAKGTTLKPMPFGDDFITLKIVEKNAPKSRGFDEVRIQIQEEYIKSERLKQLHKLATARLETFNGQKIIARFPTQAEISTQRYTLGGLDFYTSMGLLQHIFDSHKSTNYAIMGENAFLFRIVSQSVSPMDSKDSYIDALVNQVKMELMTRVVFDFLEQRYKIKKFI